jgi:hypothetical protein
MRNCAQKAVVILATGYILFFFSERVFWSFLRPGDKLSDLLLCWLVYCLLAWVFLLLVRECRVAAFSALFLAGAVFGWLAEGVVVDTMYGSSSNPFPASISFTGLAWHALISAGIGWYWQGRLLATANPAKIALFSIAVGLCWGVWAGWWPSELGKENASLANLAGHSVACSILLCVSWAMLGIAGTSWFRPARFEMAALLGIAALVFVCARIPATPRSALILPPLLLLCAIGLRRNRINERRPDLLEVIVGQARIKSCLLLLLMPIAAIAAYAPVAIWGWTSPANWALYVVTMPMGFVCLARSLWVILRQRR